MLDHQLNLHRQRGNVRRRHPQQPPQRVVHRVQPLPINLLPRRLLLGGGSRRNPLLRPHGAFRRAIGSERVFPLHVTPDLMIGMHRPPDGA